MTPVSAPPLPPGPMLPTAGPPPRGEGWMVELKADGARALSRVHNGEVLIRSRPGNSLAGRFPEVTAALNDTFAGRSGVVDGELVALDRAGLPDFGRLQRRLHRTTASSLQQSCVPVRLWLFDVLNLDGRDLTALPYRERRRMLEELVPSRNAGTVAAPAVWSDVDGADVLGIVDELGAEGIVCKHQEARYRAGRTRDWIKTPIRRSAQVMIAGVYPGRTMPVGSLLLAGHDPDTGELRYCGSVSAGLGSRISRSLHAQLRDHRASSPPWSERESVPLEEEGEPARGAVWLRPTVTATIEYRQFTGRRFRHPAFKGFGIADDPAWVPLPKR